jgi:hypothetical protein
VFSVKPNHKTRPITAQNTDPIKQNNPIMLADHARSLVGHLLLTSLKWI